MSNPPGWVPRSTLAFTFDEFPQKVGATVAGVAAGVVTAGQVNSQPVIGSPMQPARWSYIWFGVATLYLVMVYTGHVTITRA